MLNERLRSIACRGAAVSGFAGALFAIAGCGIGSVSVANVATGTTQATVPGVRINGHVHGGAYPIQNAAVVLMETQSNGVWTAATNNYVGTGKALYATKSDANGSFNFPDTGWSCDPGQYLYIEVTNGKTANASGSNPNVVQLGVVGSCAADLANKAEIDGLNVFLSEPSTIAAAYALRSFISIHNGTLAGVANDGSISTTTTIPLVDITAASDNNAIPAIPGLNPANQVPGPVQASLSAAANVRGIYNDGSSFNGNAGFDQDGNAYSERQLGTSLTYAGVPYTLGSPNQANAVKNGTIALPNGYFDTLNFLGAGTNGNQANQPFVVTYTDGTTTTFTQSMSDWFTPQNYAGEAPALITPYRNTSTGGTDARTFNLYQYSFALNGGKSIASLRLPANVDVGVLAVTLTTSAPGCNGVRSGTALSCTAAGLTHAFQNAYNLVDQVTFNGSQFPSGLARIALPGNAATVAPQQMVNTLGNILQSCVDSTGGTVGTYSSYSPGAPTSTRCGDLFYWATAPGSTTSPTNTLQAALNMANYPTHNVANLYALQPRAVFFTPDMSTQPSALTLSIFYNGTNKGDTFSAPADLALDEQDNIYLAYGKSTTAAIDELTSAGTGLFSTSLSGVATTPKSVAVDLNDLVWVTDDTANPNGTLGSIGGVTGVYTSISGGTSTPAGTTYKRVNISNGSAAGLAFDASSNMFVTRDSADANPTAFLFTQASTYTTSSTYKLNHPVQRAAIDSSGDFYAVGTNGSNTEGLILPYGTCGTGAVPATATVPNNSGTSIAVNNSTGSGQNYGFAPTSGQVYSVNATGACGAMSLQSPANTYNSSNVNTPAGTAMDGGLNLFWTDNATGLIYELAGIGNSTNISTATALSFAPCYVSAGTCASTTNAKYLGMAIDSSGAMWYLSNGGTYGLVQTLGMADPTWPLLASENSGVVVQ